MSDYEERLVAPSLWWAGALGLALLGAAALHGGGDGPRAVLPYALLPVLALTGVALASRGRVQVAEGVLHVPGARIPLAHVGAVTPLDREATRRVRGPLAEPRAYVVTRAWLPRSVRVQVADPEDDTPYWLVGTRDPQALTAALVHEQHAADESAARTCPPHRSRAGAAGTTRGEREGPDDGDRIEAGGHRDRARGAQGQ
ncbi:MAG: DUF3093 domain-containing protein [Mycobacteriales bacterium]